MEKRGHGVRSFPPRSPRPSFAIGVERIYRRTFKLPVTPFR